MLAHLSPKNEHPGYIERAFQQKESVFPFSQKNVPGVPFFLKSSLIFNFGVRCSLTHQKQAQLLFPCYQLYFLFVFISH